MLTDEENNDQYADMLTDEENNDETELFSQNTRESTIVAVK